MSVAPGRRTTTATAAKGGRRGKGASSSPLARRAGGTGGAPGLARLPPPRGGPDAPSLPSPPPVTSIPSSFWKLPVFFFLPQVIKSRFFLNPAPDLPSLWTPICEAAARLPRYTITHTERERNALVLVCVCVAACRLFIPPTPNWAAAKTVQPPALTVRGPAGAPRRSPRSRAQKL